MASSTSGSYTMELELRDQSVPARSNHAHLSVVAEDAAQGEGDASSSANIPPADRGFAAWKMLCVFFVFEALLWGFPLSYGVFQDYYSHLPEFANDPYVSVVGTIASGLGYLGAPFITPFIKRYMKYRRHMIVIGWPLCILSLVAGSFAKTLPTLILTQGVMYGLGFLLFYYPILSMIEEFWIERRGMAFGILCGASGVSGAIMPIIIQNILEKYGYQTTLRAIAVGLFVTTGPLVPFLKGRLPASQYARSDTQIDWSFLKNRLFWVYSASNVIQGLGYFYPSLYLPSYATSIGLSSMQGALLLTTMSVSQVLGQFAFGYFSDRKIPLNILIIVSLLVSSTSVFALWGVAMSFAPLLVFAMFFGFFAAGYTAMWARMVSAVSNDQATGLTMFSFFCFGKGVGNVLAGPVSAKLLLPAVQTGSYGAFKFKAVVIFTGAVMLLSTGSIFTWYLRPRRWILQFLQMRCFQRM